MKEKQKRDSKKIVSIVLTAILVISAFATFVPSISAQNEDVTISIPDCSAPPGENVTVSIMIDNVTNAGVCEINLTYNASVVHVLSVTNSQFDMLIPTIDNPAGLTVIGTMQMLSPGLTGEHIRLCDVELQAVGNPAETSPLNISITTLKEAGAVEIPIPATPINGTFQIPDETAPDVTNPSADPIIIANAAVIYGATESQLDVTVTDQSDIASVTVNLSSISGLADQPMTNVPGTDIYTTTTTASIAGVHSLPVNATDVWGNSNTSVNITLTVVEPAVVTIEDNINVELSGTVIASIMINGVSENAKVADAHIKLTYNASVVHVNAVGDSQFEWADSTIDNMTGVVEITAMQLTQPLLYGDVQLCNVTFEGIGPVEAAESTLNLSILDLKFGPPEVKVPANVDNGSIKIIDETAPVVTDPSADPVIISNASVIYGATESQLNVTVTDASPISSVTIDLTSIGGSATEPMINIPGTDVYTTMTTASIAGVHLLQVNATDESDNSNTAVNITLTVVEPAVVTIEDNVNVPPGGTVNASIMINGVSSDAAVEIANIILTYNASVVHVTAIGGGDFDFVDANIDNVAGFATIDGMQLTNPSLSGDVQLCNVTFEGVGPVEAESTLNLSISELVTEGPPAVEIPANVDNGSIKVGELNPPVVVNPVANPDSIPDDTDNNPTCVGTPCTEMSELSATITDDSGVASVTIDLSPIGGLADRPMDQFIDYWYVSTNASAGTAGTHELYINATDIYGNYNDTVSITLVVIKNGDVSGNNVVDLYDAMYLAKWKLGQEGFDVINERVAEVSGSCAVDLYDAMYLAKWKLGQEGFDVLK